MTTATQTETTQPSRTYVEIQSGEIYGWSLDHHLAAERHKQGTGRREQPLTAYVLQGGDYRTMILGSQRRRLGGQSRDAILASAYVQS